MLFTFIICVSPNVDLFLYRQKVLNMDANKQAHVGAG